MEAGDNWATGNQGSADPSPWGKQNFGHQKHGQKHMTAVCVCVCVTKGSDYQNVSNEIT